MHLDQCIDPWWLISSLWLRQSLICVFSLSSVGLSWTRPGMLSSITWTLNVWIIWAAEGTSSCLRWFYSLYHQHDAISLILSVLLRHWPQLSVLHAQCLTHHDPYQPCDYLPPFKQTDYGLFLNLFLSRPISLDFLQSYIIFFFLWKAFLTFFICWKGVKLKVGTGGSHRTPWFLPSGETKTVH